MQIFQLLAGLLSLTALTTAGPLRRDAGNRPLQRRYQNTTSIATASDTGLEIIPIPYSSMVSYETEMSTTIAMTDLVPLSSQSTSSLASQTSSLVTPSIMTSSTISSSLTTADTFTTAISSIISLTTTSSLPAISNNITSSSPSFSGTSSGSRLLSQASVLGGSPTSNFTSSTSYSREYPLITNPTSQSEPPKSSSMASPVTDTFTAAQSIEISQTTQSPPLNTIASEISIVVTIVMPTNGSSLSSSTTSIAPSSNTTASASPTSTVAGISTASLSQIPTVISAPAPTNTDISASTFAQNLAMAKGYNALFSSLTPSSSCTSGSIACISGSTGNCDSSGLYKLTACGQGQSCFAVPMNTTEGVYVGCFDTRTADDILGIVSFNSVSATLPMAASTSSVVVIETATSTPIAQVPQTFNSLSVTIPTASPGVIVPETSQGSIPSLSPSLDLTTTTIRIHQTSTMVVYVTPHSQPAPVSSPAPSLASKTSPAAEGAGASTQSGSGSLITIIPINPSLLGFVTVTVTATVTTTERIEG